MSCTNNLKQIALALHTHHDAQSVFPGVFPFDNGTNIFANAGMNYAILPFIEQSSLYEECTLQLASMTAGNATISNNIHNGPGAASDRGIWCTPVSSFLCPSDAEGAGKNPEQWGRTSYMYSHGDFPDIVSDNSLSDADNPNKPNRRGFFKFEITKTGLTKRNTGDISDGLSNTIAVSEHCIAVPENRTLAKAGSVTEANAAAKALFKTKTTDTSTSTYNPGAALLTAASGRYLSTYTPWNFAGQSWGAAMPFITGFATILPPNSPNCITDTTDNWGSFRVQRSIHAASSYHTGGVSGAFGDASVRFITETIDTGDLSAKAPVNGGISPYGVWGAIGSIAGGETDGL
jgi:hypothetical protein